MKKNYIKLKKVYIFIFVYAIMDKLSKNKFRRKKMTYDLLKTALNVSSLRQETISSNISNVNTPGYKTNKVLFEQFLNDTKKSKALNRTHDSHIRNKSAGTIVRQQDNLSVQDNGNNVDIDYEMAALSANNVYYDAVVSQLNSKYSMLRTVMK